MPSQEMTGGSNTDPHKVFGFLGFLKKLIHSDAPTFWTPMVWCAIKGHVNTFLVSRPLKSFSNHWNLGVF